MFTNTFKINFRNSRTALARGSLGCRKPFVRRTIRGLKPCGCQRIALSIFLMSVVTSTVHADIAEAKHGMVASVQPLATDAGVAILKSGGNAVDAAIATALTLGVVDGHNSGIGGGCFMLVRLADGRTFALDGREMAGAKTTATMFIRDGKGDTTLSQNGPLASGVPGSLAVYQYAAEHFGKKKLADLLAPGADYAEHGFPLEDKYAKGLVKVTPIMAKYSGTAAIFLKPDGSNFTAGDIIKQPDLAASYRSIATDGIGWFYGGPFAQAVDKWMAANGGILTTADFANYQMKVREPLITQYRDYTIIGFPPPSSGGVHVAEILNILNRFDISALQKQDPVLRVHVISEAMKLAFADRAFWLGDPDFVHVPKGLIDANYGAELAKKIRLDKCIIDVEHGVPPAAADDYFGKHTTHIAAADDAGNWVGITATVNTFMGSKVIVPGTGIILNDQMDDFSIQPGVPNAFHLIGGEANAPGPGKRPLSSMSPTIILHDGQPVITVGAAGGPKIITQVLLVTSNLIDLKDDLATAMSRPRFHHQWSPDQLWIENTFPPEMFTGLEKLGHTLDKEPPQGATQAIIRKPDGTFVGASEPRLPGKAAGW
jgi:gamma-glutamyltranspeptidase / glutathione hydrolase